MGKSKAKSLMKLACAGVTRNRYGMWETRLYEVLHSGEKRSVLILLSESCANGPTASQMAAIAQVTQDFAVIFDRVTSAALQFSSLDASHASKLRLVHLHVAIAERDGLAAVGFEFDCDWNPEAGVGILTHDGQPILAGQADVACLEWKASQALTTLAASKQQA